jgi:hypothetical protein
MSAFIVNKSELIYFNKTIKENEIKQKSEEKLGKEKEKKWLTVVSFSLVLSCPEGLCLLHAHGYRKKLMPVILKLGLPGLDVKIFFIQL